MGVSIYAGTTRFGRVADNRICERQDLLVPHAIKGPYHAPVGSPNMTPPVREQGTDPPLGPPVVSCQGMAALVPPTLGGVWVGSPKPRSWKYQYVPSLGSCSDVSSLKIEFQMSGFIRGSLKLAPFLTHAHMGLVGEGWGTGPGYQRGGCSTNFWEKLKSPLHSRA